MSRYYLLSGLSRIFRKPFANVYISRKVPFAQTFQIYACGPRLYKTFHGFLHDSHVGMPQSQICSICFRDTSHTNSWLTYQIGIREVYGKLRLKISGYVLEILRYLTRNHKLLVPGVPSGPITFGL